MSRTGGRPPGAALARRWQQKAPGSQICADPGANCGGRLQNPCRLPHMGAMRGILTSLGLALAMAATPVAAELSPVSVLRPEARPDHPGLVSRAIVPAALEVLPALPGESTAPDLTTRAPLFAPGFRPPARSGLVPRTRWQHMRGNAVWTRAALSALKDHGRPLVDLVPGDIADWCPAYPTKTEAERRAFWVGFMSALAKHESTYKPWAVGGGGLWYGLLQILPSTARGYRCRVGTGEDLKNGAANLSCAVRIMAHTVPRDGVIHGYRGRKGQGVTADWGPMHSAAKRRDMAGWLKRQTYCQSPETVRPRLRPLLPRG